MTSTSWVRAASRAVDEVARRAENPALVFECLSIARADHAHDTRRRGVVDDLTRRLHAVLAGHAAQDRT